MLLHVPPVRAVRNMQRRRRQRFGGARRGIIALLPAGSIGAEIGVWQGDFSDALLRRVKPQQLHLIDPWAAVDDEVHAASRYGQATTQAQMDDLHRAVLDRFADQIGSGQVVVHRKRSDEAAIDIADASLDWVYIDGDHSYDAVLADLRNYAIKVRSGGLLIGDDFVVASWWGDSVVRAVKDFAEEQNLTVVEHSPAQFVIRLA